MTEMTVMAAGLEFPEGPVAMPDGSVLVVEIKRGTVARCDPDGTVTRIATLGGGPNGAALGPDGKLYVCNNGGFAWSDIDGMLVPGHQAADYVGGSIQRVDIDTGAVETLYTGCDGHALRGPNDIVFDAAGGFYFTDLGKDRARELDRGGVYYAAANGSHIVSVVYGLDHPNGIALAPDGDVLYVAETHTGRVWSWDIVAPGEVGPGRTPLGPGTLLMNFPGYQLIDSMAVERDGNLCVATLITGAITVISPSGEMLEQVPVPGDDIFVTNICFGGEDMQTAFVTSSGRGLLYTTPWPRPGLRT